ncbi:MAG: hypothetical protein A2406_01320 [Candidatus Komeilibacteria bacterium RIFOXYC1_FULL_37_11]|uniref:PEP-utilising enzyme mobile domain-containing protein n=1 Tax=Candidatus Komeilibacteria bacterium RIFOXYC1_FULL_37_11 TaxID=1798555 RepID=A0A1G2C2W7_9BACT|nr:MAG: hypothetical protein A2406_01320 [Candidatus Komeilibacteria bacterium RIFOXYC1_FULL_37_11]OGY95664.1 MAG: hypothetical protein A2611_02690 [Candidatus Komeilibacteria bacterium RIFOXYD1_FULL_37_29]
MKNKNWNFVYSEGHSLLLNEVFFNAFTNFPQIPGIFKTILYINRHGDQTCYVPPSEMTRVRQQGKIFFDVKYRAQFKKNIANQAAKFNLFWQKYKKTKILLLNNDQLLSLFKEYIDNLTLMCAYYQVSGGRSYPLLEEYVKQEMYSYFNKNDVPKYYSLVLTSTKIDLLEREEIALLKLSAKKAINSKQLIDHAINYAFHYLCGYNDEKILSSLKQRILDLKKKYKSDSLYINKFSKERRSLMNQRNRIMKKLIKNKQLVNTIQFLREQGRLRFEYKEWFFGAEYKFLYIFKEIAKRLGISLEDYFLSYRIDDTIKFLQNDIKVSQTTIYERSKIFIFYQNKGKKYFYSGKSAEEKEEVLMGTAIKQESVVRGVSANPGKVSGKVRIILPKSFEHIQRALTYFQQGEVLITTMTQPSLISIMKRACAMVTNQGGITSHAAIISREFDIPCIVGTHIATEVFKDGDMVEVDADHGIVRKL